MKPEYEPVGTTAHLGYLIEEAGEVLAAAGKTLRWGLSSVNPDLPAAQQETNEAWLQREMNDLEEAIWKMRDRLAGERPSPPPYPHGSRSPEPFWAARIRTLESDRDALDREVKDLRSRTVIDDAMIEQIRHRIESYASTHSLPGRAGLIAFKVETIIREVISAEESDNG